MNALFAAAGTSASGSTPLPNAVHQGMQKPPEKIDRAKLRKS
jgi:hypothetical protein